MKKIVISCFILFSFIALFFVSKIFFKIGNDSLKEELIVGTASGYAPWVSVNEKGEYEGFDIDVISEVAKKLNKKLVIKDLGSMAPLFISLEQGSIDLIIWGMSIFNDRLKKVDMVRYYGDDTVSYPLLFWNEIPKNIQSIDDMKGMKVCVEPASSQENVINKYDFITKINVEKIDDCLLNLQFGRADAVIAEPAIAKKFITKYPQIKVLNIPLAEEDQIKGVGICIQKNNRRLFDEIANAILMLEEENIIESLQKKWKL